MADGVGPAGVDPPHDRFAAGDVVDIAAPRSIGFEEFVRAETAGLLRSAYLLTGSSASAEDVVQETLTRLFPKWSRVQAAAYPKAYVHRTMVNTFLNSRRSKSSQEIVVDDIGDRPGPDDLAQRVTDADLVWGLLDRLGERQRAALVLRYFHDWTDQDIAHAVGCRTGTVRSLISRGLSALRADLDSDRRDEGGDDDEPTRRRRHRSPPATCARSPRGRRASPGLVEQRVLAAARREGGRSRRPGWLSVTSLRPVAVAASVLLVVGAGVGGVALVRDWKDGTRTGAVHVTTTRGPSPTVSTSSASSGQTASPPPPPPSLSGSPAPTVSTSSESAASSTSGPTGGSVPAQFEITDVTFVSTSLGWALGSTPTCAKTPCTSLVRTRDGGRTWLGLAPPVTGFVGVDDCAAGPCVAGVRYATALIGYIYGPKVTYLTRDGGATWSTIPGGALALEISGNNVLKVTTSQPGCTTACTYLVQKSAIGARRWQQVLSVAASATRTEVQLVRAHEVAYVQVYGWDKSGTRTRASTLYSSTDNGTNWTARAPVCATKSASAVAPAYASDLAVTPVGDSVTVLCQPQNKDSPFVSTSSDFGRTFVASTPHAGLAGQIAAVSASTLLATTSTTGGPGQLVRSIDGGRTWSVVATASARSTFGDVAFGFLGFESSRTGRWVSAADPYRIWTTTDAGATWTPDAIQ